MLPPALDLRAMRRLRPNYINPSHEAAVVPIAPASVSMVSMGALERIYRIERLLKHNRAVPIRRLVEELEVSRATVKRDIAYLRDRLNAPIVWDRDLQGYRFDGDYSLPALYLTGAELQALLVLDHLVGRIQPELLGTYTAPLRNLLQKLLGGPEPTAQELMRRVRIVPAASRPVAIEHFQAVCTAVLTRRRLELLYFSRTRNESTRREVSPQRLVHYRDHWYMDAWCHLRQALRSFALDAIQQVAVLDSPAVEIPAEQLDRELGAGYGIFSGPETRRARLRFSPRMARWVSRERWHAEQCGRFLPDGGYLLEVPYSEDRELIMDLLRYGPDVEVLEPEELRRKVRQSLLEALQQYQN